MAYPNTIQQGAGSSFGQSGGRGQLSFEHSGNQYLFLVEDAPGSGDNKLHAWKSTDQGQTWARQDDGNAQDMDFHINFGTAYTCAQDGSQIWVIHIRVNTGSLEWPSFGLTAVTFDCSTDTWGSPSNYTSPVQYPVFQGDHPPSSNSNGHYFNLAMAVRSSGDYEIIFSGLYELDGSGNALGRVWTASFDGSTFGAAVMVPGQSGNPYSYCLASVSGDSAGAHVVYHSSNTTNPIGAGTVYHVNRDASGAFGAVQQISNTPFFAFDGNCSGLSSILSFKDSSVDRLALCIYEAASGGGSATQVSVYYADSAVNPTWSGPSIVVSDPSWPLSQNNDLLAEVTICLGYANGSLVAGWADNFFVTSNYGPAESYGFAQATYPPSSWSAVTNWQPDFSLSFNLTPVQIIAFSGTAGVYLIGVSLTEPPSGGYKEQAQAFLVPIGGGPPPPTPVLPNRVYLPGQIVYLSHAVN